MGVSTGNQAARSDPNKKVQSVYINVRNQSDQEHQQLRSQKHGDSTHKLLENTELPNQLEN